MSKAKRYIEIIPTLTITTGVNRYGQIVWAGSVKFKLKHNMKHGFWAMEWNPKKSELKRVGLTLQEFEEIDKFVSDLNYYSNGRNRMVNAKKEYLIEDAEIYIEEVREILKFSKYEEIITFEPLSRLEEK